jgi:hypothetical protein
MDFLTGVHLLPLQSGILDAFASKFKSKISNPSDTILFVLGIGIVIIILVILNMLKTKVPVLNGTQTPGPAPRKFSIFTLHRLAGTIGLDKAQTDMLDFVFRSDGVQDVEHSFNSPMLLDQHFKRAYHIIQETSLNGEEAHEKLTVLFSTRNIIETSADTVSITSTRQIPENSAAVLAVGEQKYPVRVISSRGENLVVENPLDEAGQPISFPHGTGANLSFFNKSSKGFSVETRILDAAENHDKPALRLAHSGQIDRLSNRRFRRRQQVIATSFFLVHIKENGQKKRELEVDQRRLTGNILDIAIGGCSIAAAAPVPSGSCLKIEFTWADASVAALGQVLRTNQTGMNTIMHVKFLKVPRRSLNIINALVYEYSGA